MAKGVEWQDVDTDKLPPDIKKLYETYMADFQKAQASAKLLTEAAKKKAEGQGFKASNGSFQTVKLKEVKKDTVNPF